MKKNEYQNQLIASLRVCKTEENLEDIFKLFEIKDISEKKHMLLEAMYNPEMFFSCAEPDIQLEYDLTIEIFLTMSWKLTELCQKIDLCGAK